MRKQSFGKYEISVIGMGTAEFGGRHPEGLARDLLDAYVSIGGNLVDTARVYGDFATPRNGESEKIVGRWMEARGNRRDIFLSTKGGHPPLDDMHRSRLSPEEIRGDMAASLEDLRTDYVDIYWLHRDDPSRPIGQIMESYSRCALCQLGDCHYLLVTMAKPLDSMPGLWRMADVLCDMGVPRAYALDGGQTGSLIINDKLINPVDFGEERTMSDIIYFATALPREEE